MRFQLAILITFLVGTALAAEANLDCNNRVNHLIHRIFYANEEDLTLDQYRMMYDYVDNRLLHNKTYTNCYNYSNEMCQLATTQLLPKLISYVRNNTQNLTQARSDYHYLKHVSHYFLSKCGLGITLLPEKLTSDDFSRATCKKTAESIYNSLSSLSELEVHSLSGNELLVLFRTFFSMFGNAHQRVCLNPTAYTSRVIFIAVKDFLAGKKFDRVILIELWKLVSYLGVEYLKDAGLNHNITQMCGSEIDTALNYLRLDDGYSNFKSFSDNFTSLMWGSNCFNKTNRCTVFRDRITQAFFNKRLVVESNATTFSEWWSLIRFNSKQFIYDCHYESKQDLANPIWTATYNYENPNCTEKVSDALRALRGTFFRLQKPYLTYNALYYLRNDLNDVNEQCFAHTADCSNYKSFVNSLMERTLGLDVRGGNKTERDENHLPLKTYDIDGNIDILQFNALKWIHHCTKRPIDVVIPKENQGCAKYVEEIREVISKAAQNNDLFDAQTKVRQNKKLVELYKDCNAERGANKLCIALSEQVRELYVRALFTNDPEAFRQKLALLSEALKDVTDECKALKIQ